MAFAACGGRPLQMTPNVPCARPPVTNYLAEHWQQCWFTSPHGRWRTLSHELHYSTVVLQAEATSLDDAQVIAERIVDLHRTRFDEILVYVSPEGQAGVSPRRRVQWTRQSGFAVLDF